MKRPLVLGCQASGGGCVHFFLPAIHRWTGSEQRRSNSQAEGQGPLRQAILCDCNSENNEKRVRGSLHPSHSLPSGRPLSTRWEREEQGQGVRLGASILQWHPADRQQQLPGRQTGRPAPCSGEGGGRQPSRLGSSVSPHTGAATV